MYAGRPPTYYCKIGDRQYLGMIKNILMSARRLPVRYIIQFELPDAYGDTDEVCVKKQFVFPTPTQDDRTSDESLSCVTFNVT